jgi:hypothetical protein
MYYFKSIAQYIVSKILFPTTHTDWYKSHGVNIDSNDSQVIFKAFTTAQKADNIRWKDGEWNNLEAFRDTVKSYNKEGELSNLDVVHFTPLDSANKPGEGLHIVNFFGRLEYYECNFKDMIKEAHATGATIWAFNPSGMNSSTGSIRKFDDLVKNGISVVNHLLEQGIHPDNIILQGNCLGGAVSEATARHFEEFGINLRQINSNSFKSIKSVIMDFVGFKFFEGVIKKILAYAEWEMKPGKYFNEISPYKVYMHREGDKTIGEDAKLHAKITKYNSESSDKLEQESTFHKEWFLDHALFTKKEEYKNESIDPHELDLYKLQAKSSDISEEISAYDFINRYLSDSNEYIKAHPQDFSSNIQASELVLNAQITDEEVALSII